MFLLKRTAVLFTLIAVTASVAFAQANAKVSGTVTDPNGAAVPGALSSFTGPDGEVVTRRIANPLCTGSIPVLASRLPG